MKSKYLKTLPQYHFDRNDFVNTFKSVFTTDEIYELESACQEHRYLYDFHLYYADDEFYIIHLSSGTIINWYKHLGRTNTCNKEGFGLDDLRELLELLKENIEELKKGNFWYFNDGEYATIIGLKRGESMTQLEKEFSTKGFANKMRRLDEMCDVEVAHYKADQLMCELLTELGYGEGVEIFKDMSKWYA